MGPDYSFEWHSIEANNEDMAAMVATAKHSNLSIEGCNVYVKTWFRAAHAILYLPLEDLLLYRGRILGGSAYANDVTSPAHNTERESHFC